ncbi:hypothetical protein D3C86_1517210 [compost metagenome]
MQGVGAQREGEGRVAVLEVLGGGTARGEARDRRVGAERAAEPVQVDGVRHREEVVDENLPRGDRKRRLHARMLTDSRAERNWSFKPPTAAIFDTCRVS